MKEVTHAWIEHIDGPLLDEMREKKSVFLLCPRGALSSKLNACHIQALREAGLTQASKQKDFERYTTLVNKHFMGTLSLLRLTNQSLPFNIG